MIFVKNNGKEEEHVHCSMDIGEQIDYSIRKMLTQTQQYLQYLFYRIITVTNWVLGKSTIYK